MSPNKAVVIKLVKIGKAEISFNIYSISGSYLCPFRNQDINKPKFMFEYSIL
jgi:hypothetical protein